MELVYSLIHEFITYPSSPVHKIVQFSNNVLCGIIEPTTTGCNLNCCALRTITRDKKREAYEEEEENKEEEEKEEEEEEKEEKGSYTTEY